MNKFYSELEKANYKTLRKVEEEITNTINKSNYLSLDDFLDLEWVCKEICVENFSKYFEFDIINYLDVKIKMCLDQGRIALFPGNLFTSFLMKNKLQDNIILSEEEVSSMNLNNMFQINGFSYKFDLASSTIINTPIH